MAHPLANDRHGVRRSKSNSTEHTAREHHGVLHQLRSTTSRRYAILSILRQPTTRRATPSAVANRSAANPHHASADAIPNAARQPLPTTSLVTQMRPKHLAIALSKLQPHPCTDVSLEQYATEGDLAAYWLLAVDQLDGLEGKTVLDLGAGNGVLGLGALMLGASRVVLVEIDDDALSVLRRNIEALEPALTGRASVLKATLGLDDVSTEDVDIVLMNPPWGVQKPKADRPFLETAFSSQAAAVHLLHSGRAAHLEAMGKDHGWQAEAVLRTDFRLPATYAHHAQRRGSTDVVCWRFHRPDDARLPNENDV